jgi:hypothetical protein
MKNSPLLLLLPLLALGCFESEITPYGPEAITGDLPDGAQVISLTAANLTSDDWEEYSGLFESGILSCGFDETSGFRSEPVFQFEMTGALQEARDFQITQAYLKFTFAAHYPDSLAGDDNPDLGDDVMVRLWLLPAMPAAEETDLNGAIPIPFGMEGAAELDTLPIKLDRPEGLERFAIPTDLATTWLDQGEPVILALGWVAPGEPGNPDGVNGMINLHSLRTGSDTGASLILYYLDENLEDQNVNAQCSDDGMVAQRTDPGIDSGSKLVLLTGYHNAVSLHFSGIDSLWDLLEGPELLLIKATLTLYPDSSLLFGLGPKDRHDNIGSLGYPSAEGGLTMRVSSATGGIPEDPEISSDDLIVSGLNLMTTVDAGDDSTGTVIQGPALKEPLVIPLIEWLQDYSAGTTSNKSLVLSLNRRDERLRQLAYHLEGDDLTPRLEITYIRRPGLE